MRTCHGQSAAVDCGLLLREAAPAQWPRDFFNAVAPRGLMLGGGPQLQFQISADSSNPTSTPVEFGNVNGTYPTAFAPFSAPRLFACTNDTIFDVTFFVPGTDTTATVTGFGAVFTDVDTRDSTQIECFDRYDRSLFTRSILATAGNGSLSFFGILFDEAAIARVRITAGNGVLGPNDVTQTPGNADIVVLDDLVYGEPQAIP